MVMNNEKMCFKVHISSEGPKGLTQTGRLGNEVKCCCYIKITQILQKFSSFSFFTGFHKVCLTELLRQIYRPRY